MIRLQKFFFTAVSHFLSAPLAGLAQVSGKERMVHVLGAVNPFYGLIEMRSVKWVLILSFRGFSWGCSESWLKQLPTQLGDR